MTFLGDGVPQWIARQGRLSNVVRQHLVASQLAELAADAPLRVLDAGCGQGTQALLLARAGNAVTGLDPSPDLLAEFRAALAAEPADVRARVRLVAGTGTDAPQRTPGPFDLVCCHGVLMYLDDPGPILAALSAVAAPGARMSLLVRNGLATAMRAGLRGDAAGALAAFDRLDYVNRLGIAARAHTPAQLDGVLAPLGWRAERWFGVRVFSDHRDEPTTTPGPELDALLAAEREAGRRDPYRQVAALLHLVYTRTAASPGSSLPRSGSGR